jgi:hypothetical protein
MSQAKFVFERPADVDVVPTMPKSLPKTLRKGAATRRDPMPFVPEAQPVMITAVKIPFIAMVWQLIKLALAAIPAAVVLGVGLWGCMVLYGIMAPELSRLLTTILWGATP